MKSKTQRQKQCRGSSKLPVICRQPQTFQRKFSDTTAKVENPVYKEEDNSKNNYILSNPDSREEKQIIFNEIKQKNSRDNILLPVTNNLSKSAQTLHGPWYMNMEDVRSNINNRLSTSLKELSSENATSRQDEPDLTPFMFAHPDGTPRTMYIMPSFEKRFQQAIHARYIRKPGTKLDPIEKELDIAEIFEKKNE